MCVCVYVPSPSSTINIIGVVVVWSLWEGTTNGTISQDSITETYITYWITLNGSLHYYEYTVMQLIEVCVTSIANVDEDCHWLMISIAWHLGHLPGGSHFCSFENTN